MTNENFKNIKGVCNDPFVLSQIDAYLIENAAAVKEDTAHSIDIEVNGKYIMAEIYAGCYAHENSFEIKIISKDEEIGYCEVLHAHYL
jgi:hypothetical protein